jgi:hypothetical protein
MANGHSLEMDEGVYGLSTALTPTSADIGIYGFGAKSLFTALPGLGATFIDINTNISVVTFRDFKVQGGGPSDGRTGIKLRGNSSRHVLDRLTIAQVGTGIYGHFSWVNSLRDCTVPQCGVGIDMGQHSNAWLVSGGSVYISATAAIRATLSSGLRIEACNIAENTLDGVSLSQMDGVVLDSNYFENNNRWNTRLDVVKGGLISANHFSAANGGAQFNNTDAKLIGDAVLTGCDAVSISNNKHDVFVDARQKAHIHLYDFGGANTNCEIGPNSGAVVARSNVATSSASFPSAPLTDIFYLDGQSNKDQTPFNGAIFSDYNSATLSAGQTLTSSISLGDGLTYDLEVIRKTGANTAELGAYKVMRTGSGTKEVATLKAVGGVSVAINAGNQVVVTNATGSAFIRYTLMQRMPA